ncbi:MAG: elongation factor G [Candidatus Omnitrophica bacterium]|nr:elongation factor G [Candidatus Omnitrophota bacterium]
MKEAEVGKKRNIAVVGHHGSGKTSLIEALLYLTGGTDRLGRIADGNTTGDYFDEERERKHTIYSKILQCRYNDHVINLIDTPGYSDFVGDIKGALRAVDGVLLVINGQSGVEVETEKIWEYIEEYQLPRCVVVNRLDKERADFGKSVASLESVLKAQVCPVRLPYGQESEFKGVIDLITNQVLSFDDKGRITKKEPIPADVEEEVAEYRQKMIEASVVTNESLMERYLSDEKIPDDDIRGGLRDGALSGAIVPIFATDAYNCVGIQSLLDGLINYMPDPLARKTFPIREKDKEETSTKPMKEDGPGIGFVFKSLVDPFIGKVSFVRVFSGVFQGESEWANLSRNNWRRVGHILSMNGKKHTTVNRAVAGDIVAVAKIDDFETNDTLATENLPFVIVPTQYPQPPIHMAIKTPDKKEEDKLGTVLPKLISGDPTIVVERRNETRETVISAAGSLQIEILAQKLRKQYNFNVELSTPRVAYRETITAPGEGSYRHKKQTGGRGQFGEVHMRLKPLERGKHFEFINSIFGGAIPGKFIPAVEKGVVDAMQRGIVAGYPVVDVQVDLFDGKFHDVDSSEMAFKIAGSMCFQQVARDQCKPALLEPIMNVSVSIPETYMGDVMGDLNARRGRVLGMDPKDGKQIIKALVPLAEMYTYAIDLRSITQGRGSYEMAFSHYEQVPHELAEKIIAESKMEVGAEE